jgi:hypothetical protein
VGPIFLRIRLHHWAAINTAAMGTLTVTTKAMAMTVAMQGGMTFHTDMFCKVKTALDVAVIRLVNVPGIRSAK